ncbi:hypothetical protein LINPERHAP1_LOCUS41137 [Linum perenne]
MALLGKQAYNLQKNPTALISWLYKAKYYTKGDLLTLELDHHPNFMWQSIWKSHEMIQKDTDEELVMGRELMSSKIHGIRRRITVVWEHPTMIGI